MKSIHSNSINTLAAGQL